MLVFSKTAAIVVANFILRCWPREEPAATLKLMGAAKSTWTCGYVVDIDMSCTHCNPLVVESYHMVGLGLCSWKVARADSSP
jgi:hypothetical protein